MADKYLEILSTSTDSTLQESCRELLGRIRKGRQVLSLVFFLDSARDGYRRCEGTILEECRNRFGLQMPMVTCVAQKPLGASLSAEVLFMAGDGTVQYNEDYLVIRSKGLTELMTQGIHFPSEGDTGAQAKAVFARIGEILDAEGFSASDIVRQWNYIQGITEETGGIQNYQMFNDARSLFYSSVQWKEGYPAATGIGSSDGGVNVAVYAVKGPSKTGRPIDNPLQVPAHRYSGKVLAQGREAVRTTPKFERGRLLGDTVFISGTAAIKGEDSELSTDPVLQTRAAIDVVEHLVEPGNICPGCRRFRYDALRVYIKHEEDSDLIARTVRNHWKGVPVHFMVADICRPELLLEIEGTGSTRRFLECCCTDEGEALEAQRGGARRIELCEDLPCGGITPSRTNLENVIRSVDIPVNVLVRPRGGNFVFSEDEVRQMVSSIGMCRELGANGVVIGALREDGSVDMEAMHILMAAAKGMQVTFHRAFDECSDPLKALEDIISLGCDRLLTAGHASNVNDGAGMLRELNAKADGRIIIMAGSGVRPGNIDTLEADTRIVEFHSSSHGSDGRTSPVVVAAMARG